MIEIQKARFKNFLSFGNKFTTFNFNKRQRTVIIGKNGKGKSTIIDVLVYGFYGKTFRKIKKAKLINNINNSDLVVEIYFKIKNTQYKIVRGMKPNIFDIYVDDILVPQDSTTKDYQRYLENDILNLNYSTFTQIVILGSSSYIPFMRMYSNAKREIIEDILNISVFSKMNEILKQDVKETEQKLMLLEKDKELVKKQYSFLYEKYTTNSTSKEKKIEERQDTIKSLEEEKQDILFEIEEIKSKLYEINLSSTTLQQKLNKIKNLVSHITKNLNSCKKKISFYNKNDICPECDQTINKEHKDKKLNDLEKKKTEYNNAVLEVEPKTKEIEKSIYDTEKKKKHNKDLEKKITDKKIKESQLESQITYLTLDIEEIKKTDYEFVSQDELTDLSESVKTADVKVNDIKKQIHIMKKGLEILKDSGAKTAIIKFYLPLINKTINHYLERFDFNIKFLFDENFDEHIKGRGYSDFSYGNFSEGEKLRVDLSLMNTWREIAKKKNSASTNLLFFDEILDSAMDSEGIEKFMAIIDNPAEKNNIFIISHRDGVSEGNFDSVIELSKDKQFSEYSQKDL